ncbi:MAG: hypothetical protein ABSG89_00840 [Bacteroidales bacterium]|jgi:enamine deaminase RidA (YjgF/YER057c/UK114 family)
MTKTYIVCLPEIEGVFEDEWRQCLNKIIDACSGGIAPVKLNIFADLPDFESLLEKRGMIINSVSGVFGKSCPAVCVTVHPPVKPWKVEVEGTFEPAAAASIQGRVFQSIPYIVIESDGIKEVWAAGISSYKHPGDTRKAAGKAFDMMVGLLREEGMSLNDLVRQWNYIGDILAVKDGFQNYQLFNEVRNEYYHSHRTISGYPAATGVGMRHGGVILDFCAIRSDKSIRIMAVDNPNQVNAYNYGQQVLIGLNKKADSVKHAPQFERALLIADNREAILHISGTASIIGQETMGKGDVGKQTRVTLENIKKLTDIQRLCQMVSADQQYFEEYSLFRVYIKKQEDFGLVRDICHEHFPEVPAVFIEADICRDDLLMEIEGESELRQ